jgi:hypothetical protein
MKRFHKKVLCGYFIPYVRAVLHITLEESSATFSLLP